MNKLALAAGRVAAAAAAASGICALSRTAAGGVNLAALLVHDLLVGQCRLTLSKPILKAPMVSALESAM